MIPIHKFVQNRPKRFDFFWNTSQGQFQKHCSPLQPPEETTSALLRPQKKYVAGISRKENLKGGYSWSYLPEYTKISLHPRKLIWAKMNFEINFMKGAYPVTWLDISN